MTAADLSHAVGRRRWTAARAALLVLGLGIVAVGAPPAYRHLVYAVAMQCGRQALIESRFDDAVGWFSCAARQLPQAAEPRYRLAVAYRRSGHLDKIESELRAAEARGWDSADLERQRLLMHAQVGRFHDFEKPLRDLLEQRLSDEAAEEVYEALAHGYWANHDIKEAIRCLNFWIQWKPQAVQPRLMLAEAYDEFNDPASAEQQLRELLAYRPNEAIALELLGSLLLRGNRIDEAEKCFHRCRQLGRASARVLLGCAECAYRGGRIDEAEQFVAQVKLDELPPETQAKVLKLAADIAQYRRDHVKAIALLEQALSVWPHDAAVHQSLGQSYAAAGKAELAERHLALSREITQRAERFYNLQRQVISRPNDPELRFLVGDTLAAQGLLDDAATWWRSALRVDPLHQPSLEAMARYYQEKGQAQLAAQFRRAAEAAVPGTFRRAWRLVNDGLVPGAEQLLALIRPYPQYQPYVLILEAALLNKAKRFDEALAKLDALPQDVELRTATLIVQAEALIGLDRPLEAEPKLREAVALSPQAVDAHRWLAVIYYDLGAVNHAEYHLQQVAALAPEDPRPLRLLGLMNKDYEVFDRAIAAYQECLRRQPPQKEREEVLLELAECLIKQRDYTEALKILEQAVPSPDREVFRAECYYNQGDVERAVTLLEQVFSQTPDHARALLLRSDAYLVQGETEKGVAAAARAAQLQPNDYETAHRYAQALLRAGQQDLGQKQLARAEELRKLREEFSKLHEQAFDNIYDAHIRRRLADVAGKLGRDDLAEVWNKAADVLEQAAPILNEGRAPATAGAGSPQP
ncbi:MAG: hypothetical protein KatS3mg110_3522 [Pirellulaceae bacterium]|nr:MAG: hypothetical protein KatS3mg110_3522 [Pirellulaceae bacterium]